MALSRQDWLKILLGITVSVVSLAVILYFIDLQRVAAALRLADYRYIALLFLASLAWLGVRALAWRTLLQEQASFRDVFLALNEGYLLNNVLPLRLGEVGRAFLLARKAGLGFVQVMSTVIIERAMDLGFAAGLLLATLPFVVGTDLAAGAALVAGGLVLGGLLTLHLLARNRDRATVWITRLAERLPVLQRFTGGHTLGAFFDGLAALVDARRFARVLLLMALNWGIGLLQYYLLLQAFFPEVRLLWAAFTLAVLAMGIAAPSSPGAVGVMEAAIMAALLAFGLDRNTALAAALMAHLANYAITGIIGAYALLRDGLSLGAVFRDVRKISPAAPSKGG
jgi:uncharacterized protein (TIRG00374 family)